MKIKSMLDFYNNIYYIKWKFLQIENFEETKERIYYKYQWKKNIYESKKFTNYEKDLIWDFLNGYCDFEKINGYVKRKYL